MTDLVRKTRIKFTPTQKLEYAKLMVEENYSNNQIIELSGASSSAVVRWKKQYLDEKKGEIPSDKIALDPQIRRIQELEQQLAEAKKDNEILKNSLPYASAPIKIETRDRLYYNHNLESSRSPFGDFISR